ncbi:hypothetical protein [Streptomyces hygroscopicus]|uniref:hypothetical protein n=1 Tax=Streptomyces hygroscopicus TaxID=1912 RepID=UPI000AE285C3|nr:hypothetical protein [Streptomyces hygroscopicus]
MVTNARQGAEALTAAPGTDRSLIGAAPARRVAGPSSRGRPGRRAGRPLRGGLFRLSTWPLPGQPSRSGSV